MSTRYLLFISLSLVLGACQSASSDSSSPASTVTKPMATEDKKPELPFEVHQKFSELEYIFQYQNDTTYVINFWATWCKPCIKELPYFEQLDTELATDKVKVILVSLDFAKDVETKLLNFVKKRQLKPLVIALTDGKYNDWIDKVHPDWSGAIPITYIYKKSEVIFHNQQYDNYGDLKASVQKLALKG